MNEYPSSSPVHRDFGSSETFSLLSAELPQEQAHPCSTSATHALASAGCQQAKPTTGGPGGSCLSLFLKVMHKGGETWRLLPFLCLLQEQRCREMQDDPGMQGGPGMQADQGFRIIQGTHLTGGQPLLLVRGRGGRGAFVRCISGEFRVCEVMGGRWQASAALWFPVSAASFFVWLHRDRARFCHLWLISPGQQLC